MARHYLSLISAWQAADSEFDAAAREFTPGLDFRHIGSFWEFGEIVAGHDTGLVAGKRIGVAPPSVLVRCGAVRRPFGKTACKLSRLSFFSAHFVRACPLGNLNITTKRGL